MHVRVASRDASCEKASIASFPHAPYVSATRGTHNQPSSLHLGSLALCFLPSVARAADPADTPASIRVCVLSGEVTEMSKAAVLPVAQLDNRKSLYICIIKISNIKDELYFLAHKFSSYILSTNAINWYFGSYYN